MSQGQVGLTVLRCAGSYGLASASSSGGGTCSRYRCPCRNDRPSASKYTLPLSVKCQVPAVARKVKPTASATKMTIGTADPSLSRLVGVGGASTGTAAGSSSSDGGESTRREITQSGQHDLLRQE